MAGERLAEIRKDHQDTQESLARKLVHQHIHVTGWEQEKSSPSHRMLIKICQFYGVSADYLLGLTRVDPVQARRTRERLTKEELAEVQNTGNSCSGSGPAAEKADELKRVIRHRISGREAGRRRGNR